MFLTTVAKAALSPHRSEVWLLFGAPGSGQRGLCPKLTPQIFSQEEHLAIVCMKEQRNADNRTVQGGRGEFSGSAQIHVYMSEFRVMNLAGVSKETFPRYKGCSFFPDELMPL